MTRVFGEVAAMYDDARPGYPDEMLATIIRYHGGAPKSVADVGAGTGKGTDLLLGLGAPVIAVEPDPRMAAVLAGKFPRVRVVTAAFEDWTPPPGGVELLACATAWHWMDEQTRGARARAALTPRGTLAVFHNRHSYADPHQLEAINDVFQAADPTPTLDDRPPDWVRADLAADDAFTDVEFHEWHRYPVLPKERYLRLVQTFSTFRRHPEPLQRFVLGSMGEAIDGFGGAVRMDVHTVLALGRPAH